MWDTYTAIDAAAYNNSAVAQVEFDDLCDWVWELANGYHTAPGFDLGTPDFDVPAFVHAQIEQDNGFILYHAWLYSRGVVNRYTKWCTAATELANDSIQRELQKI